MRIYRLAQEVSSNEDLKRSNQELQILLGDLKQRYFGLILAAYEDQNQIKLNKIEVPLEMRHQGIGSEIIKIIQDFAQQRGKPLVVAPEAERGYKKKLDNFYKDRGFVNNKGKNFEEIQIKDPHGATMYWSPQNEDL